MVFPLDVIFYNRAAHDRRSEAASEKLALEKVQPPKEAPKGQLKSLIYYSWQRGALEPSLLTSSLIPKEQVFCFHFSFLAHISKKQISDRFGRKMVGVIFLL